MLLQSVLSFWFEEIQPQQWWRADAAFDDVVRSRFLPLLEQAKRGELYAWRAAPKGRLAEIIVLDQFSRNIHRGSALAFAQDAMALALAQEAVVASADEPLAPIERVFLYMPFMHSESRFIHEWAEKLYRANGLQQNYEFELKHKAIIDRFGRYPHRNAMLGRTSTPDELTFLQQPGSSF